MSKSDNSKTKLILKIVSVATAVVVATCGAFFGIQLWEDKVGEYNKVDDEGFVIPDSDLEYDGKKYDLKDNVETVLIMGLDKYDHPVEELYNNNMQADFLMLLVIDNDNKSCTALHINRDTVTSMNVLGVAGDKVDVVTQQLALAHTYGNGKEVSCRNTADAVSNLLLNIEIDYYMSVTMDAVSVYNDFVGGVEVTVLDDFSAIDDTLVKGSTVTLKGEHALNYVRSRKGLSDATNNSRMVRQQQYLEALYNKTKTSMKTNENFVVDVASQLAEYIVSNCSGNRLQSIMEKVSDYELTEIMSLEGETKQGENFMEFYPDGKCIEETVIKLFYTPKD